MVIDHVRNFVNKFLEAASHKQNEEKKEGRKQQTLKTVLNCKMVSQVEKVRICQKWIKVCTEANPLTREFLQSRVVNSGAILKCSQLCDYYLFDVYQTERANLKEIIKKKWR